MRSGKEAPPNATRIVEVAMRLFAEGGIEATSLRAVAQAASISPALVVHHFGGKQGLVAAVDELALAAFGEGYAAPVAEGEDLLHARAVQTAAVMRQRPDVCAYLGRALVEGTAGSADLLRLMIEGGRREIAAMAAGGALRGGVDPLWATLQHFFLIWAPLAFRPLLEQEVLDGSLLAQENLDRWVEANVSLLREGLYRER